MSDTFPAGTTVSAAAQRTAASASETNRIVVNVFNGVEMAAIPGDSAVVVISRHEGLRAYLKDIELRERIAAGQDELASVIINAVLDLPDYTTATINEMAQAGAVAVITAGFRRPAVLS